MILFKEVILKHIYEQEKAYPWPRPEVCPRCNHYKVWGHGYVARLFDGFRTALLLKCYRCPTCGCVITLRPKTYFLGIQAPIAAIRAAISCRLKTGRWPSEGSSSRKRHWLVNLRRRIKAHLTNVWDKGELDGFDRLQSLGIVPVSRLLM